MLGCVFMLTHHGPVEYEQKQEIIQTIEAKAKNMTSHVKFDRGGWGHVITEPDEWITRRSHRGQNWMIAFAYSDQGMLYHW